MVKRFLENGKNFLIRKQGSIFSAAVILMLTYAASMILGILRERILVAKFYSCCRQDLDVYYAAFRLPDMVFQLVVTGALSASFMPIFGELLVKDEKLGYQVASSLINILFGAYFLLSGVIFIFAKSFSGLITGGFTPGQVSLMAQMTRVMLFGEGLLLISNFLTGILQSHRRFILSALAPLVYNLGIILATVLFAGRLGIWAPVLGVTLGALFHLLLQAPLTYKLGFHHQWIFGRGIKEVKEIFQLMLPRTFSLAVYQIEATVGIFLATSLPVGSLTIFHLAQKLMDLPIRLFGASIGQAALPVLSTKKAEKDAVGFKESFLNSLSQVFYLSLPAMFLVLVLRVPLVRIAYGAREFPWLATILTGRVVALMSLAIFSESLIQILSRGFYAFHETRIPFWAGLASVFVYVISGYFLAFGVGWGIVGLAAATFISSFLEAFLLWLSFAKFLPELFAKDNLINWAKIGLAAFLSGFFAWGIMRLADRFVFDTTRTFFLLFLMFFSGSVGLAVYWLLTEALGLKKIKGVNEMTEKIAEWKKKFFFEVLEKSKDLR